VNFARGKLNTCLAGINRQAQEGFEKLIEDMKQAQGIKGRDSYSVIPAF